MTSETETTGELTVVTQQTADAGTGIAGTDQDTAEGSSADMGGADEPKAGRTHEVVVPLDAEAAGKLLEQVHDALQQHVESIEARLEQFKSDAVAPLQEQFAARSNRDDIAADLNKLKIDIAAIGAELEQLRHSSGSELTDRVTKIEAQIRHMV